ncbi:MAG: hypothetical protein ACYCQI_10245 [Gammaproteobacteria bacterium]
MKKVWNKIINLTLAGMCLFIHATLAFADGTDVLADPTKNLFATFVGTGINLLLLTEIVTAGYVFSTKERKLSTWVGLPILILVTTYAKVKFGGGS